MQNSAIIAENEKVSAPVTPYHRDVACGQDFHIDLLFYHLRPRCFVVIDLKMKDFKPEYAGKINFYPFGGGRFICTTQATGPASA